MLSGHITEATCRLSDRHVWSKLADADKKVFDEVLMQATVPSRRDADPPSETKTADELRKLGKNVVEVDREAFR